MPTGAELHAAIADHYSGIEGGSVDVAPFAPLERSADLLACLMAKGYDAGGVFDIRGRQHVEAEAPESVV